MISDSLSFIRRNSFFLLIIIRSLFCIVYYQVQSIKAFETTVLPPTVSLNFGTTQYSGHLVSYEFRQGQNFEQLNGPERLSVGTPLGGFTAEFAKRVKLGLNDTEPINLKNKSELQLLVNDLPANLTPRSLFVTVYEISPIIKPVRVLEIGNSSKGSANIELPKGSYILHGSLTWMPGNDQNLTGYVYYTWNVRIV
ncbi:MAG TPA: hypothetical protein VH415_16920 [Nitrososphaeraceae archaeon]